MKKKPATPTKKSAKRIKPPTKPTILPTMEIKTKADWDVFHRAQKEWAEYQKALKEYEKAVKS